MDDTEIDLRAIFELLRRQFRLILISVIAVLSMTGLVLFILTPNYTSSALVLVDPRNKDILDPSAQMTNANADSARIDSEVELIRSDNVLLKVIEDANLVDDSSFGVTVGWRTRLMTFLRLAEQTPPSAEQSVNYALSVLRNSLSVQRRNMTNLISVQVRSEDPSKAAMLANAVAKAYIEDQLEFKVGSVLASRDILEARIAQARTAIVDSEKSYDTFITANLDRIAQQTGRTDLATIQAELADLNTARGDSLALASLVQNSLEAGELDVALNSLQSQTLDTLEQQRTQVQEQLASSEEGSPIAVNLREQLATIERDLEGQVRTELQTLQASVSASNESEASLRQQLRSQLLGDDLPTDVLTEIYSLQQSAELARSQYQTLLSRAQDLDTQANLQVADSRIVSPALAPQAPSFPNVSLILTIAALAGIGLGIVLAFLYEHLIGGFTSEGQMEAILKIPVATVAPRVKAKSERDSIANMTVNEPLSVFAEAIRRLRATITQTHRLNRVAGAPSQGSVVMVTSTAPNEGKTTISLSLARSYALSGQRTLLIDCDLRKPSIHRHLNLEPSHGLLDMLSSPVTGEFDLKNVISMDPLTPATIVIGARRSDLPTDQLLASEAFGRLISASRKTFDVIVLDTPPVGPVVDALYIAPFCDFIVFVSRWASTSQIDAGRGIRGLNGAKRPDAKVVAVLNQQDETRSAYQRKYGGYYSQSY